jgi:hypothetical protein
VEGRGVLSFPFGSFSDGNQHGGALPTTREQKNEFKIQVRDAAWNVKEANFSEAVAQAYRVSTPTTVCGSAFFSLR